MSISALSSNLINDLSQQQRQNPFQQIKQDFQQLASALQSGDLQGAQSAYSNIQQVLGNNATSTSSSGGSNTLQNDFATLGQALQSGDLTQAQSAFSQLQSDFQAGRQSGSAGAGAGGPGAGSIYIQRLSSAECRANGSARLQPDRPGSSSRRSDRCAVRLFQPSSNWCRLIKALPVPTPPSSRAISPRSARICKPAT